MRTLHTIDGDFVEFTVTGRFPAEDIIAGFHSMLGDDRFPDRALLLINVTASDTLPPAEAMQEIAQVLGSQTSATSLRIAILVADQLRYGLARQLSIRLESTTVVAQPFHERESALSWLNDAPEATSREV